MPEESTLLVVRTPRQLAYAPLLRSHAAPAACAAPCCAGAGPHCDGIVSGTVQYCRETNGLRAACPNPGVAP